MVWWFVRTALSAGRYNRFAQRLNRLRQGLRVAGGAGVAAGAAYAGYKMLGGKRKRGVSRAAGVKKRTTGRKRGRPRKQRLHRQVMRNPILRRRGRKRARRFGGVLETNPHGGEHIEAKFKSGRKMRRSRLTQKMALVTSEKNIDRYQAITYPRANFGYYRMDRTNVTNPNGTVLENMPLFMFELGTFGQNVPAANGAAGWRLQCTTALGPPASRTYSFTPVTSQTINGNTLTPGGYVLEDSNTNYKHRRALFEWSDIRIEFVAPASVPTKLYIEIVQFKEDGLLPDVGETATGAPSNATVPTPQEKNKAYFYDNLVNKLCNGPLWVNNPAVNLSKMMRVLYRRVVHCDAQQFDRSTVSTMSGQERVIKIFKYFNRVMQFDRTAGNALPTLTAANTEFPNELPLSVQQVIGAQLTATELGPRRIFLIVRAENSYTSSDQGQAIRPGICPSFDILIRNKLVTSEDTRQ